MIYEEIISTFVWVRTCSPYLLCACGLQYTLLCGFFLLNEIEQSFVQRFPAVNSLMQLLFSKSLASALLRTK